MKVSVVVMTLDEELNLPRSLQSVAWSDDIVVFDSFSSDRTLDIARSFGARVVQRSFDDYAGQRNAALHEIRYKHPWVLMLDADECVPDKLRAEIEQALENAPGNVTMYRIRRKDMFMGKWLHRSSGYPTWFGRLFQPGTVTVRRRVNEEYHTDGETGYLQEHLTHYPFGKGMAHWFERHNRYSSMEAVTLRRELPQAFSVAGIFSRDPVFRRKSLKHLAYRMPCRPCLTFCYLYFVRMGFLDGRAGLTYCTLRAIYEYMIDLKIREHDFQDKFAGLNLKPELTNKGP